MWSSMRAQGDGGGQQPGEGSAGEPGPGALPSRTGRGCCAVDLGELSFFISERKEWVEPTVAISHCKDFFSSGLSYRKKKKVAFHVL